MIPWPVVITLFFLGVLLGAVGVAFVVCLIVLRCLKGVVFVEVSRAQGPFAKEDADAVATALSQVR